ncbi:MAG: low molecular weight protein arginine phosphatase [Armatimonadetes bacterium]|nr:low molecular weight protein arginine phosphatase [Armatimonadota bacterium]
MRILFICQANMCRSPMAEALARKLAAEQGLGDRVQFRSAGLWAADGLEAVDEAVTIAEEYGADLRAHHTTPFCLQVAHWADYIIAMTRGQKADIVRRLPILRTRVYTLAEWVREVTGRKPRWRDVEDPVGGTEERFRKCAALLHQALSDVLSVLAGATPRRRGVLMRLFP